MKRNKAQFPVYIVSKGRADSRYTSKTLERMRQPYRVIIEPQDYAAYAAVIDPEKLLLLPERYQAEYPVMDDYGRTQSTGPGPARNFAWDHALEQGAPWHWVMDDNIEHFFRLTGNRKHQIRSGVCFRVMEDFCLRYENVAMGGPTYEHLAPAYRKWPPFFPNTRIYSCNLIRNDTPYRWRGRYNEDTDLSLRMLKDGWCTVLFYVFLQGKIPSQVLTGGNTAEFYNDSGDRDVKAGQMYDSTGTVAKSEMIAALHPDVAKVVWRYGRVHHAVEYKHFLRNTFRLKPAVSLSHLPPNEYGITLQKAPP